MPLTAIAVQKTRELDAHDEWFAVHIKENQGSWRMRGVELRAEEALHALIDLGIVTERALDLLHQAREQFVYRPGN